ncbi:substrate-binding domain-containing protein [Pontibacter sp. G13]|uniref:PstS family phosphate ABC transporter substrate-binding protein n=1 Tax=Pontibacter sp. G13 TaxID=3074898 RepID=UPI0028890E70|nr:substrate-binding domain-containing protein [Pontibacter sp. G13]WNJ16255.1 substrate-binding domain-containing protein [Pontibacter sp. G13]
MSAFRWAIFTASMMVVLAACQSSPNSSTTPIEQPEPSSADSTQPTPTPSTAPAKEHATVGEIEIVVDESLKPIIEQELEVFHAVNAKAVIHATYLPAEEAIQEMLNNRDIRLVISSRILTDDEKKFLVDQTVLPDYTSFGRDAIAVVNHPSNPVMKLDKAELQGVLSGKITSWKQIDPAAPEDKISLIFDHPQSSVLRFLTDSIMGGQAISSSNVFAMDSSTALLEYVKTNPGAIGFVGWAWLSDSDQIMSQELMDGLQLVLLEKQDGANGPCPYDLKYVGPWQSYLATDCYPLRRHMTTILRESIFGLGTGFVSYLNGPQGQRIVHKAGLNAHKGIPREVKFPKQRKATAQVDSTET